MSPSFSPTPNPNAIKCILDRPLIADGDPPRSYRSADAAKDDPIAAPLFAIEPRGCVTGVLINDNWITVNKSPDADWKTLKPAIAKTLESIL